MNDTLWLRAADCPLLQTHPEAAGGADLRPLRRVLELCLKRDAPEDLARAVLEEIGTALGADRTALIEASPSWQVRWQHARRGLRVGGEPLPARFLAEVLDRGAAAARPAGDKQAALIAAFLGAPERDNRLLFAVRPRTSFTRGDLEYAVAAAQYFGTALDGAELWQRQRETCERLEALVAISQQLVEQRETAPLLEHIAEQAARLLRCERASIFLWDQGRRELVGRPALGLPGGELRIPDTAGIVGRVVQTGEPQQVNDVKDDPSWSAEVDSTSGFRTRNLLCVPLTDPSGQRVGAVEVLNKKLGKFTADDVKTLEALAGATYSAIQNVRERESLLRSNAELSGQAQKGAKIIGESEQMRAVRTNVETVARIELPVLILGESGTGKDVVARAIHYGSKRQRQPFVPVNCAAIAETLLESELFGHEKGAFTDAHATRAGKFEAANGGTLFLDEIGDLSPGGQAKLLRVLEEKVVFRVGGTLPIPVDTRIVAATNRNLGDAVNLGKFRGDLFFRLMVVKIDLPALRERRDDVLVLAEYFLKQFCRDAGRKQLQLGAEARKRLEQHSWPGNVRELRNLMERLAYLCPGERVESSDIAFILQPRADEGDRYAELTLSEATKAFERDHILKAIERAGRNMSEAAKLLGLHRPNLYRKMKLLEMEAP